MKFLAVVSCIVFLSTYFAWPQYPDTLRVPVTFYDFHSDGSNPEFEINPGSSAGRHIGMVADTLDAQRKPFLGPTPYYNCQIAKWFRPWTSGDFTIPNYTNPATAACGNPLGTVDYDTAFKNIVIQDTLIFTLANMATGTYEYVNPNFFPLDGKGFGNEIAAGAARTHNYSFSMELHWEFKDVKGLMFNFESEDDMWVYIDGRLAIDLGGIHGPSADSINFDTVSGLTVGKRCSLDVFFTQRDSSGSDIRITTNIFVNCTCPYVLRLEMTPNKDTIIVGDSVVLNTIVMDDTGAIHPEVSSLCEWSLSPSTTASYLSARQGSTTTFYANAANQMYSIILKNNSPTLPVYQERGPDSIKIYVKPSSASIRFDRTVVSRAMKKSIDVREFYNLSGRKLQGIGSSRVDGIVLERTVTPGGKVSVKRKFQVPDSPF